MLAGRVRVIKNVTPDGWPLATGHIYSSAKTIGKVSLKNGSRLLDTTHILSGESLLVGDHHWLESGGTEGSGNGQNRDIHYQKHHNTQYQVDVLQRLQKKGKPQGHTCSLFSVSSRLSTHQT